MKRVFRGVISVFIMTVFSVLSLGMHAAAALPMNAGHSMGMSHKTSSSTCFTICTIAIPFKEEDIEEDVEDEEGQPQLLRYTQSRSSLLSAFKKQHEQEAKIAINQEPPPDGLPAYIRLAVFRA